MEPSLFDAETVYAGVEDAAIFRSTDGGTTWKELPGLRTHPSARRWQPGAGGMCLHTIVQDPTNEKRLCVAISSAGVFGTDDGGETWQPMNKGLVSKEIPEPTADVGHCVHRIAMHPSKPDTLFMQKHWDVMRSDDGAASWREISGNLPTRLRVPCGRSRPRAGDGLRRADQERLGALPAGRQAAGVPKQERGERVGAADEGAAAERTAT